MDFHAITPEGETHVCTVNRDPKDGGPVLVIHAKRLMRQHAGPGCPQSDRGEVPDAAPQP